MGLFLTICEGDGVGSQHLHLLLLRLPSVGFSAEGFQSHSHSLWILSTAGQGLIETGGNTVSMRSILMAGGEINLIHAARSQKLSQPA